MAAQASSHRNGIGSTSCSCTMFAIHT